MAKLVGMLEEYSDAQVPDFCQVPGSDHLSLLKLFCAFEESGYSPAWCATFSVTFSRMMQAQEVYHREFNILSQNEKIWGPRVHVNSSCTEDVFEKVKKSLISSLRESQIAQRALVGKYTKYRPLHGHLFFDPSSRTVITEACNNVVYHNLRNTGSKSIMEVITVVT